MSWLRTLAAVWLSVWSAGPAWAGGAPLAGPETAPHADQLRRFGQYSAAPAVRAVEPGTPKSGETLERVVYGYLPYWEFSYDRWHWDGLTHLAYFSVGITSSGEATSERRGWCDTFCQELVAEAHENGVRVHLTLTNMSSDSLRTLLTTPANSARAVETIRALVLEGGADGVNIDFEGVPGAARDGLTAFVASLAAALDAVDPALEVTLATPAVDWSAAFDYDQLAELSDGLMIMAYNYHYSGGNPGPVSPLSRGSIWGQYTVQWTVQDYLQYGGAENRAKFWLGLPWYGFDWIATSSEIPGTKVTGTSGDAMFYEEAAAIAAAHGGWQWDAHSQTPYVVYQAGGDWHQLWCDNPESFDLKLGYVNEQDLGGIGIWALGYEGPDEGFWVSIAERFGREEPPPPENRAPVAVAPAELDGVVGVTVFLDGSASTDPDGDALTYRWSQSAGPYVALQQATFAEAFFMPLTPGDYAFDLVVDDGQMRSLPATTVVHVLSAPLPEPAADVAGPGDTTAPDAGPGDAADAAGGDGAPADAGSADARDSGGSGDTPS